tara:strand:- start:3435 stop:4025 length:591 start_codon:yes stop_codon:yes gene_type:complete
MKKLIMQVSNEEARYEDNEDLAYDRYEDFKDGLILFAEEFGRLNKVKTFRMECFNSGWRNTHGYTKDLYLDDKEDIFKAFTREYDFQINMKLYSDGSTDIQLSSHDSPMGETLYMIPIDMVKTEKVVKAIRSDEDLYHTIYCITTYDWNCDRQQLQDQGIGYIDSVNIDDQDLSFDYIEEVLQEVYYYNFDGSIRT